MRTITQILIDADNAQNLDELSSLWQEIRSNLTSYPLVEIEFSIEHMKSKGKKLAQGDIDAFKELIDILNSND